MKALVLGGVKSGKSRYAETLATSISGQVTYIATATPLDSGMAERIRRHREDRDSSWCTVEEPLQLAQAIRNAASSDVILVDCLTLWLTNLLLKEDEALLHQEVSLFEDAVSDCRISLIMVSNETNMGIVPLGELSRRFCDEAGMLHQRLAGVCDRVELIVAGLPLKLK
ncbi:bifunctional adenosylcobinamide kinase/adenosylcobinamide-phosphate guanylyltransferase [Hahella sp. CCB-MM4]|uniref:bifunctional adenosylcobinamide kinase/adenosylcobinamide-phosphate guanylyltransferase n=1 Tax=Hahella sp. (strain CCB-MM4) TaxID=1926491 RepID=UPI000B9A3519|nr:bifunctional adenosylcobinamide kinase/adenosylcobinamide-phosphate guanylyltransferase [Hahella sp. CCB-MM4]OZG74979.1 bifunctional adenosylcobinamide kinase/adenosylcobinamide-phosphate guanylyltransferase [Hahella sp. CCB-MM4]